VLAHFDPGEREIYVRLDYLFHLVFLWMRNSRRAASLGAYARMVKAKSVIAYDNIPELYDWAKVLPRPIFIVQHGMRQLEDDRHVIESESNVTFLSWGELQRDEFKNGSVARYPNSSHLRRPKKIIPIGSLRDSMYRAVRGEIEVKQNQICLISQFKGLDGHGLTMPQERQTNLDMTAEFTVQYAIEHNLNVLVALYSDTPEALKVEKEWYREKFGDRCQFNNPEVDFATYFATDESVVSIGVHTSVLWEVFGRGGRILACNFTGDKIFTFPIPGPWYLHQGTYLDFSSRLTALRMMSEVEYLQTCGDRPRYLISYESSNPTHLAISKLILDVD
jgi:surface carbohydrate biosynthesis protein